MARQAQQLALPLLFAAAPRLRITPGFKSFLASTSTGAAIQRLQAGPPSAYRRVRLKSRNCF